MIAPDVLYMPKVHLLEAAQAGVTELLVTSVEGFSADSSAILGAINSPNAEIIQIRAVDPSGPSITLSAPIKYARVHSELVTAVLYDSFNIYKGASPDPSTHTLMDTVPQMVVRNITIYADMEGLATDFYSYSHISSNSWVESQRKAVLGMGFNTDITPDMLRENYLYGLDLTDDNGNGLPNSLYWQGIIAAYHWMEQQLHIDILPKAYDEHRDFRLEEYLNWIYLQTDHYPINEVQEVSGSYYGGTVQFPMDWVRPIKRTGQINLVPGGATFASFLIPSMGGILPILNRQISWIPGFWHLKYTTGFAPNELPYNMRDMICKRASFMPLNILGDLVGGVAIASKSIGIDGLSQSINTTNSAENAGYSGRLRQYEREMKADLPSLAKYWRRINLAVI
jgi:hypothetical protein